MCWVSRRTTRVSWRPPPTHTHLPHILPPVAPCLTYTYTCANPCARSMENVGVSQGVTNGGLGRLWLPAARHSHRPAGRRGRGRGSAAAALSRVAVATGRGAAERAEAARSRCSRGRAARARRTAGRRPDGSARIEGLSYVRIFRV